MELEVPLEIARSSQITWTITPHSTPSSTRNPDPSPLRAGSIPAPDFGPAPFVSQASCNFQANADVFTEPIAPGTLNSPSKHKPPPASTDKPATSRPRAARTMSPDQPPFTQPRPGFATHHARGTFGQDQFSAVDGFNNETHGIDPNWPVPAYPCQDGERHPDEPLPNIPVHPKRYYVIFKGLRPGVYYDVWCVYFASGSQLRVLTYECRKPLEILCKGLKGGVGEWKKYPTYRRAVLEFEKGDIAVIPNIGYW